jgi:cytochrome P450
LEILLLYLLPVEDTTANVIAWTLFHMIEQPELQTRMRAESYSVLGNSVTLENFEDTSKLPLIEAAAFESMRMNSVAPLFFLEANQDIEIGNIVVEKGTNLVALTHYCALQDSNFSEGGRFYPDRWISSLRPPGGITILRLICPLEEGLEFVLARV